MRNLSAKRRKVKTRAKLAAFPLECYSKKRLAEFRRNNEEALAGLKIK